MHLIISKVLLAFHNLYLGYVYHSLVRAGFDKGRGVYREGRQNEAIIGNRKIMGVSIFKLC